jgi:hypothetical protein
VVLVHIASVLPTDLKQRVGNLAEGAELHRFHQLGEEVAVGHGHLLELLEARRRLVGVALVRQLEHSGSSNFNLWLQPLMQRRFYKLIEQH